MTDSSTICRLDYCDKPASTKRHMLCSGHDAQMRRGKPFKPLGPSKYEPGTVCTFGGCNNSVKNFGLCVAHYMQQRRGIPLKPLLGPGETPPFCEVDGCNVFASHTGYCPTHQSQVDAGLKPHVIQRFCEFETCDRKATWRGLCGGHGGQRAKGQPLTHINERRDPTKPCDFPRCGRKVYAVGLCIGHYGQRSKGRALTPIKHVVRRKARTTAEVQFRDQQGRKLCIKCQTWADEGDFYSNRSTSDNLNPECKTCCQVKTAKNAERTRASNIVRLYKMTPAQFDAMFEAQGCACAACGSSEPIGKNWAIDHDHACCPGKESCGQCVRGVLCAPCNLALGVARDDADRLRGMANYLDAWSKPKAIDMVA